MPAPLYNIRLAGFTVLTGCTAIPAAVLANFSASALPLLLPPPAEPLWLLASGDGTPVALPGVAYAPAIHWWSCRLSRLGGGARIAAAVWDGLVPVTIEANPGVAGAAAVPCDDSISESCGKRRWLAHRAAYLATVAETT